MKNSDSNHSLSQNHADLILTDMYAHSPRRIRSTLYGCRCMAKGQDHYLLLLLKVPEIQSPVSIFLIFSTEVTKSIFYREFPIVRGTKVCSGGLTDTPMMVAMPIYGNNP